MMPQPGKQTIAIHILPNISRSEGNQTMKFGQFIEHNMTQNLVEKLFPHPFRKIKTEIISGSIV